MEPQKTEVGKIQKNFKQEDSLKEARRQSPSAVPLEPGVPEIIPESQGDAADQANNEIMSDLEAEISRARSDRNYLKEKRKT